VDKCGLIEPSLSEVANIKKKTASYLGVEIVENMYLRYVGECGRLCGHRCAATGHQSDVVSSKCETKPGFGPTPYCTAPILPSDLRTESILGTRRCAQIARLRAPEPQTPLPLLFRAATMPASFGPSTSSQPPQQQATTSSNGSSTSNTEMDVTASPSAPQLRQLPGHFEDVTIDDLVVLIGQDCVCSTLGDLLISWFHHPP